MGQINEKKEQWNWQTSNKTDKRRKRGVEEEKEEGEEGVGKKEGEGSS